MNYEQLAKNVLEKVGGEKNISNVAHCATRLRFNLKDESIVNIEEVKKINGVYGAVSKAGQFQVIIGNDVPSVYKELIKMVHIDGSSTGEEKKTKFSISAVFEAIASMFVPLIPAVAACGLTKAFLSLATAFHWIPTDSQTYYIINFVADSAFYFLPMLLAYTAAQKFKSSIPLALVLGGVLLHPNFSALVAAGEPVSFLGLPVTLARYGSSVIPIILIVWASSYVERFFNKYVPKQIKMIFAPLLSLFVMAPIALIVIGPLGTIIGDFLAGGIGFIDATVPWLLPALIGFFSPLLVMTGMHYSLFPAVFAQLASAGYNTVSIGMFPSNMAQGAAALAIAFKTKNKELKELATSTGITALMGITEPALYGVTMKLKKPLYAVMCAGGLGGLYFGLMNVRSFTPQGTSPFQFAVFINAEAPMNVVHMAIGVGIAIVAAFVLTLVFGWEDPIEEGTTPVEVKEDVKPLTSKLIIASPITGELKALSTVKDETFASEVMGKGVAVLPTEGKVYAPFNGTVTTVFHTKHAIGLTSDEGVELLIHIGIDTVELNGEGYTSHIKDGDKITKGQLLAEFDIEMIKEKGYDVITPLIVTNTTNYLEVIGGDEKAVKHGEDAITIL